MTTSDERKAYMKAYREKNQEQLLAKQRVRNRAHYVANKDAYAQKSKDSQEVLLRAAEYLTRSLSGVTSTPSRKP